jgi:hypothetical protein
MPVQRGQDRCSECKTLLPDEGPCPRCGSTKRTVPLTVHTTVTLEATVDRKLIISWQEVERLLVKAEYAAALLVAAVNIEFILWENLQRFTPTSGLTGADDRVSSAWGKIKKNQFTKVTLSSLLTVAEYMTRSDAFVLSPTWDPLVREIDDVRNRIAHERGYFAKLTQLKDPDWPETHIRQVLEDAKEFCHGNAP